MDSKPELTPVEQFVVAKAMADKLGKLLSTKDKASLRSRIDAGFRAEWERTGGKNYSLRVCGEKVGTYTVKETGGVPDTLTRGFEVTDDAELCAWVAGDEDARAAHAAFCDALHEEFARWYFETTGELPDGCDIVERTVKGKPGGAYAGGMVVGKTFDADRVLELAAPALGLPTALAGLLGGADE